jgi:serine protease Do
MAYQVEAPAVEKARREARHSTRKKRFAVAVTACLLVMVIGISAGAGGAWLASEFLGEGTAAGRPVSRGNVPQIPDGASLAVNSANQDDEIFLSSDTLVINTNTNQLTPEQLYAKVKHGVVGIEISKRASGGRFAPAAEDTQLAGSGFMFTTDGYLLTNYHVIEGAEKVVVLVDDYDDPEEFHRYEAEIVGTDRSTDLAVLKIVRDELFKALPIGDSSNLRVGTFVCPVGFPLGLQKSMTYGIVSGLNREFDDGGYELSSIQFDAAVNSGNSGGPLFDLYGNVVGIVNKKIVFGNLVDNIGLAITIDEAKPVINDLLLYGRVMSRAMLGIVPLELNEYIAMSFRLDVTEGIFVSSIYKEAPAYDSDLARGDVIVEIDGIPVAGVTDVQSILRDKRPGDIVELTVIRWSETGGQRRVVIEIELVNEADLPPR